MAVSNNVDSNVQNQIIEEQIRQQQVQQQNAIAPTENNDNSQIASTETQTTPITDAGANAKIGELNAQSDVRKADLNQQADVLIVAANSSNNSPANELPIVNLPNLSGTDGVALATSKTIKSIEVPNRNEIASKEILDLENQRSFGIPRITNNQVYASMSSNAVVQNAVFGDNFDSPANALAKSFMARDNDKQFAAETFKELGAKGLVAALSEGDESIQDYTTKSIGKDEFVSKHEVFRNLLDGMVKENKFGEGDMYLLAKTALDINTAQRPSADEYLKNETKNEGFVGLNNATQSSITRLDEFFNDSSRPQLKAMWEKGLGAAIGDKTAPKTQTVAGTASMPTRLDNLDTLKETKNLDDRKLIASNTVFKDGNEYSLAQLSASERRQVQTVADVYIKMDQTEVESGANPNLDLDIVRNLSAKQKSALVIDLVYRDGERAAVVIGKNKSLQGEVLNNAQNLLDTYKKSVNNDYPSSSEIGIALGNKAVRVSDTVLSNNIFDSALSSNNNNLKTFTTLGGLPFYGNDKSQSEYDKTSQISKTLRFAVKDREAFSMFSFATFNSNEKKERIDLLLKTDQGVKIYLDEAGKLGNPSFSATVSDMLENSSLSEQKEDFTKKILSANPEIVHYLKDISDSKLSSAKTDDSQLSVNERKLLATSLSLFEKSSYSKSFGFQEDKEAKSSAIEFMKKHLDIIVSRNSGSSATNKPLELMLRKAIIENTNVEQSKNGIDAITDEVVRLNQELANNLTNPNVVGLGFTNGQKIGNLLKSLGEAGGNASAVTQTLKQAQKLEETVVDKVGGVVDKVIDALIKDPRAAGIKKLVQDALGEKRKEIKKDLEKKFEDKNIKNNKDFAENLISAVYDANNQAYQAIRNFLSDGGIPADERRVILSEFEGFVNKIENRITPYLPKNDVKKES
jgi:hypothetical protein